jgi:valyl-tRNA synthetase
LKVTPAHDENDKVLGDKHKLEVIDIFNEDASLNSFGLHYEGKDRFVVRKEIVKELKEKGFLVKTEVHINKVGTSERTKAVIEPRLSDQWFLKMEDLVKPAIEAVLGDDNTINLYPKKFENTYRHWLENIRDWNISRQLWWGQQIPAYFYGNGKNDFVVAETKEEAFIIAKKKLADSTNEYDDSFSINDLRQDEDALDTWFSSWLWPISVFDGIRNPDNKEINYYYPTNDLVTGPDILFFWVARMIIAGYEYKNEKPFQNVYLTGLVRDKQRRKMSKSLGNSPDALNLIETYGADGVRVGLLLSSAAGNDLMFDEELCQQGKQFANKIWNAFRLIKGWEIDETLPQSQTASIGLTWYNAKFQKALIEIEDHFSKYRLSDALMIIYKLITDDFSSWLLEIVKPEYQQPIDKITYHQIVKILEDNLKVLHPFMPFLTEEIWHHIAERTTDQALIIAKYPIQKDFDNELISKFEFASSIISGIRTIRKDKNIPFRDEIELYVINKENNDNQFMPLIQKLTNTSSIEEVSEKVDGVSFRVKSNEYFVPISDENIDVAAEILKLESELKRAKGFLSGIQNKLSNERFVQNAPEKVIALERKKESDTLAKIKTINASLESLK